MLTSAFRFGLVGAVTFAVDFAALWFLKRFLPDLTAVSGAYLLAVAVHFSLNRAWVFHREKKSWTTELSRYVLTVGLCWLCTILVTWLALRWVTTNLFVAKALA